MDLTESWAVSFGQKQAGDCVLQITANLMGLYRGLLCEVSLKTLLLGFGDLKWVYGCDGNVIKII